MELMSVLISCSVPHASIHSEARAIVNSNETSTKMGKILNIKFESTAKINHTNEINNWESRLRGKVMYFNFIICSKWLKMILWVLLFLKMFFNWKQSIEVQLINFNILETNYTTYIFSETDEKQHPAIDEFIKNSNFKQLNQKPYKYLYQILWLINSKQEDIAQWLEFWF